jgi:ParB family chromosome partitioning protein
MNPIREIALNLIDETDYHQRFALDEDLLAELAGSIAKLGLLVPLIVRPAGDRYRLIAGRRRKAALLRLGRETAPCVILETSEDIARQSAIADNLLREEPTPMETAVAIARAVDSGEAALHEIAAAMHRSDDWVRRQLALLDWPEDVQHVIHEGKLSVTAAANLAMVEEPQYRAYLLENAVANGATARTTAAWLQAWRAAIPYEKAMEQPPLPATATAQPMVPQAPCIVCGAIFRTDELSHVPVCARDIQRLRRLDAPR